MARLLKARTLTTVRDWVAERNARTRHLIELGGLVAKAGLVELLKDDRATLFGALLEIADRLRGLGQDDEQPDHLRQRWRRRGLRAFDADAAAKAAGGEGDRNGGEVAMSSS